MNDATPLARGRTAAAAATAHGRTAPGAAVLIAMCLGVLIAQIDTSVVNLAVQPIGTALGASVSAMQWVIDAYNLTYALLLLSGGLLADLYGRRRIFALGAAVLTLASLGCALAPSAGLLIAARTLAGVGAALLLPASLAIIRVAWTEPAARGRVLGIWASCNGLAFVIGPTLGGFLIDRFGWRSVFYVIVPFGLAALLLALRWVPESSDREGRRFDLAGQVLGALALGGLAFAAIEAQAAGHRSAYALLIAGIALVLFLILERRRGAQALVPLDLFRNGEFAAAIATTAAMTFGVYGVIFLMPMIWQASGLLGPATAGLALAPCALLFFLVAPRSGPLTERFGTRVMIASGTAILGLGVLVLALTRSGAPLPLAEVGLMMTGIGMGLNTGPLYAVAVGAVAAARSGTAAALINVARMSGATLGVALLGSLFLLAGAGTPGLRAAMLAGGLVQLAGAALAWRWIRGH